MKNNFLLFVRKSNNSLIIVILSFQQIEQKWTNNICSAIIFLLYLK